jgi:hypothetical protein
MTLEDSINVSSLLTPGMLAMLREEFPDLDAQPPDDAERFAPISEAEWESMRHGVVPTNASFWALTKLGYLPSNFARRLTKAMEEAEFYTPSTAVAVVLSVVAEDERIQAWKAEQRLIRNANNSVTAPAHTKDGKWNDAWVREWPPLKPSNGNGITHVPARYVVKLPGGKRIDFGTADGRFTPVIHESPTSAVYAACSRLGVKNYRGSFDKVLNLLAGGTETDGVPTFVPSQMAVLYKGSWTVLLTVMRNPRLAKSCFALDDDGGLVPVTARNEPNTLTITELTRQIISAPSVEWHDGSPDDATGDDWQSMVISTAEARVGEAEEPEEFNPGAKMLNDACRIIGRSWDLLTGSEEHTRPEFRLGLAQLAKDALTAKRRHLRNAKAAYRAWASPEVSKDTKKALWGSFQNQLRRSREVIDEYREAKEQMFHELANPEPAYYAAPKFTMKPRKRGGAWTCPVQEPLDWHAARTVMPANEIERATLHHSPSKPQGRTGALLKAPHGITVITGATSRHTMPEKPAERLTYRSLSTRARLVANAMMRKDSIDLALTEARRVERRLAWA